jgi:hypothetical protein
MVLMRFSHELLIGKLASNEASNINLCKPTKRAVLLSECKNVSFQPKCLASCEKLLIKGSSIIFKSEKSMSFGFSMFLKKAESG